MTDNCNTHKPGKFKVAVVIDKNALHDLKNKLELDNGKSRVSVYLLNNTKIELITFDDILNLNNSNKEKISAISIRNTLSNGVKIDLNIEYEQMLEYSIKYDIYFDYRVNYEHSLLLVKSIEDWVNSIKINWFFSFLSTLTDLQCTFVFGSIIFVPVILLSVIYVFKIITTHGIPKDEIFKPSDKSGDGNLVGIGVTSILFLLSYLFYKTKSWLFPVIIFDIGYGIKEYEKLKSTRNWIFVIILASFIISCLSGLFLHYVLRWFG